MKFHEFGKDNKKIAVLFHPACVMWDYFEYVIPLLENDYHLIIPSVPGYDKENDSDFTSVENIAQEVEDWLLNHNIIRIDTLYGCSMGGAIVTRMLANNRIQVDRAILDGGITPYQLPYLLTRVIALRDFLMVSSGKIGGLKLLEKVYDTDEYSEEVLKYMADVFQHMSYKTIWRTFESCNNYDMSKEIKTSCKYITYWYGEKEEKERKWDIEYFQKNFSNTKFIKIPKLAHAALAMTKP